SQAGFHDAQLRHGQHRYRREQGGGRRGAIDAPTDRLIMSASIYYHQVKPMPKKSLSVWAPSAFQATLRDVFGSNEPELGVNDLRELRVLAHVNADGGGNPWQQLVEAIAK